ncbi:hypothetical protein ABZ502_15150 [Streptomyces abikoensis]|uniref:hypothetical protein n=1 Tax=Streptomyces abikoensis TaxID=97398 RepID=UPI0033C7D7BF
MDDAALPALGTSALMQVLGFLFRRAEAALDRRSARRDEAQHLEPDVVPDVVSGDPGPLRFDESTLTPERLERIASLLETLGVYAGHPQLIRSDDDRLRRNLAHLRAEMEIVYGRYITFQGESRPQSGVLVVQESDEVQGRMQGLKVRRATGEARAEVRQRTGIVRPGGEMVGGEFDELG